MDSTRAAPLPRHRRLVQQFTTRMDPRTGSRVDRLSVDSKEIVTLTRQAKSITTGIRSILSTCGERLDLLTREERDTLNAAVRVLQDLSDDIERAKEAVKRIQARRDAEDQHREREAQAAVAARFGTPDVEASIVLLLHLGLDAASSVGDLRRALSRNDGWVVRHYAQEVVREALRELVHRVKRQVELGRAASEVAAELWQAHESGKQAVLQQHGAFIREVNAFLVRFRLEQANA